MRTIIIALVVMFLAIVGAVALMRGPDEMNSETFTTEAYVMGVGENSIIICEREEPINPLILKVFDIDGNPVSLQNLTPPFLALLTKDYQSAVIREMRVLVQYRINDEGQVVVDRRAEDAAY